MINDLRNMALYVAVVEAGSFSAAAKSLHLSPSVISHHIAQLEKKYDAALLYRSTRKLRQTELGKAFYDQARNMLSCANAGLDLLSARTHDLRGKLTVSLPAALIRSEYTKKIAQFSTTHPEVSIHAIYSDSRVDLVADGVDLAIRVGQMPDSSLKAKKLGEIKRKLVCTPNYASKQEPVTHPRDLTAWQWIKMSMMPPARKFKHAQKGVCEIATVSRLEVNSVEAMYQLCLNDQGLSTPPANMVDEDLKAGRLVEVLPDWQPESMQIHAVWTPNISVDGLTMAFLKHMIGEH